MQLLDLFYGNRVADLGVDIAGQQARGEAFQADPVAPAEDGGPLHDVAQLADVAGPRVPGEQFERLIREPRVGTVVVPAVKGQQPLGKWGDVLRALPERWDLDRDDIQPVKEVFPEPALLDRILQVGVRGGDESDVGLAGDGVTDALVFPVLDKAEELRLKGERQVADLVQDESPPSQAAIRPG